MNLEDLLKMAFKDGVRFANRKSELSIDDLVNDSEYSGAIELVKNNLLHNVRLSLPKRLSNSAYLRAKNSRYEDFMSWWDEQV
jgi:hypothetical protein